MDIYEFLAEHNITYERHDHPPVFTCEEANRLVPQLPATKIKNLFLCDGKGRRHFLVVVGYEKTVDLKALSPLIGVKKLRFGSPERLKRHMGVDPGSVTVLGVLNDPDGDVEVIFDRHLWDSKAVQCHPLVNTSTLVMALDEVRRFLDITGHEPRLLDVPASQGNGK
jgi:Ala-tRNA(Pro) deacylase